MHISPETNTPRYRPSALITDLQTHGWLTPGEARNVPDWHDVLCRVMDAGEPLDNAHISLAITGRAIMYLTDDLDMLPRVDSKATDADLGINTSPLATVSTIHPVPTVHERQGAPVPLRAVI